MQRSITNRVLRVLSPVRLTTWVGVAVAFTTVLGVGCSSDSSAPTAATDSTSIAAPHALVDLGAAASYGVLASSTVTCVNLGVVNADLGLYPGTAVTGFPPCTFTGALHAADPISMAAQAALTVAYNQLVAMPCGAIVSTDLGGQTLAPGVYCGLSSLGLTGEMFLDAQGDSNATFVLKAGSTLTTATAQVTLLNGAQAKNVYWQIGSSATLGVGSAMKGNILAYASITIVDNSTLLGRALAQNGAVTLGTANVITLPSTAASLATITLTPNASDLGGGVMQQFTAVGTDASGNVLTIAPVWSVIAGGGSIDSVGMFTAGSVGGTFANTVQATSGGISGAATVTVTIAPLPLATITLVPNGITLAGNGTRQFTAVGRDANGDVLAISPVWSVVAGGGSIDSGGYFTAGSVGGTFANTIQATSGDISGFASVIVTIVTPPPAVNLGAASSYGILAASTVTCVGTGVVNADLGLFPGTAVTGFPPCVITGALHAADGSAQAAQAALAVAYGQLTAMPCGATLSTDLGGQTLKPGVYCALAAQGLTGQMFLDGQGDPNAVFVIKVGSALTTAAAQVTLVNGAQAKNVYWLIGSSATLGVGSAMKGNILAYASITIVDNSTLLGRALAQHAAVTMGSNNAITLP